MFFFANYERLRRAKADTMVGTVPTEEEASGDFSQSGVDIFNPFSSHVSASGGTVRDPFPGNQIPQSLLNPAAATMLAHYVPRPNTMDMGAMFMDGVPVVVGAGSDSNNLLDQRNEHHATSQGTVRVDRVFDRGDSLGLRYSIGSEHGICRRTCLDSG